MDGKGKNASKVEPKQQKWSEKDSVACLVRGDSGSHELLTKALEGLGTSPPFTVDVPKPSKFSNRANLQF